jgi:hypothetical protein
MKRLGSTLAVLVAALAASTPRAARGQVGPVVVPVDQPAASPENLPAAPPPDSSPPAAVASPATAAVGDDDDEPGAPRAPAPAPRPLHFGDDGALVISGALSFGHLAYSSGSAASTSFSIEPAFDYFYEPNLSAGAAVLFRYSDSTSGIAISDQSVTYGVTGHVGSNVWLGRVASVWPLVSLGLWQDRHTFSGGAGGSISVDGTPFQLGSSTEITENAFFIEFFAPFLFHPASHFFVGIGPDAFWDVVHTANSISNKRTYIGVSSTVGGWF